MCHASVTSINRQAGWRTFLGLTKWKEFFFLCQNYLMRSDVWEPSISEVWWWSDEKSKGAAAWPFTMEQKSSNGRTWYISHPFSSRLVRFYLQLSLFIAVDIMRSIDTGHSHCQTLSGLERTLGPVWQPMPHRHYTHTHTHKSETRMKEKLAFHDHRIPYS